MKQGKAQLVRPERSRGACPAVLLLVIAACAQQIEPPYPRIATEIAPEFRGSWDEIIDDKCSDREPRFRLDARYLSNFEVAYDVVKVTWRSAVDIEVHSRLIAEFGGPADEIWRFKLVDGGRALSAPDGKPPFYRRCSAESVDEAGGN